MPKIIIFAFTIPKVWEEEEKCFFGKLKMFQVNMSKIKTELGQMETIFIKNFCQQMLLILKSIQLVHTICTLKQEDLLLWMVW
jgi:hypothetical protein